MVKKSTLILLIILICDVSNAFQNTESKTLTVRGIVTMRETGKPIQEVDVQLFEKGALIESLKTDAKGLFSFELKLNSEFTIEIIKDKMISKKIYYNTFVPEYEKAVLLSEFEFTMFEKCPNVDYSLYNDPVALVRYNKMSREFNYDKDYEKKFLKSNDMLLAQHEECSENEYNNLIKKADGLFKTKEYNEAKELYSEALTKGPNNEYAQAQIDEINQILSNQGASEKQYQTIVQQAENAFKQNNLVLSKELFKKALAMKPSELYPAQKIQEIDQILNQKKQTQNQQLSQESQYQQYITTGNTAFTQGNYTAAKEAYQQALGVKPGDILANQKIAETDRLINEKKKTSFQEIAKKQLYDEAVKEAESFLQASDLTNARASFVKASAILETQQYPKIKIAEIDQKLKAQEFEKGKQYTNLLAEADQLFAGKNYEIAKNKYLEALTLKPNEQYPKQRISEADKLLSQLKQQQEQQKNLQAQYEKVFQEAESLFSQGLLAEARNKYQQASAIIPTQQAPKQKILEIDNLQKQQEQAKNQQFIQLVQNADKAFAEKNYELAKNKYIEAQSIKPNEIYPKQKLSELEKLIAQQQQQQEQQKTLQAQYVKVFQEAETLYSQGKLAEARTLYQQASGIIPTQQAPKQKILLIDNQIKQQEQAKNQQFIQLVQNADKAFASKNLEMAKNDYEKALTIKAGDPYVSKKLEETNLLIAEKQKAIANKKALDDQYNLALNKANSLYAAKQYQQAIIAFQEASRIKPEESLPRTKVEEINNLIKQAETEKNFQASISQADAYFKANDFENAQMAYENALSYKPSDSYAIQQKVIAEKKIIEKIKLEASQKARTDAYKNSIAEADRMLAAKDYENARATYISASNLQPGEMYPKQKIVELDKLLGDQKRDNDFQSKIYNADNLFSQNKLDEAETIYKQALALKPGDPVVTAKLKEISQAKQKQIQDNQTAARNKQMYQQSITKADALFNKASYNEAKAEYEKALALQPDDNYAKQKLNRINEINSLLAKDKKQQSTPNSQQASKPASGSKVNKLYFKDETEKQRYLKELLTKYPPGITLEVYREGKTMMSRYVIIRDNKANDFREIRHDWGGIDYLHNDKPVTQLYFNGQIKGREGEYFNKIEF